MALTGEIGTESIRLPTIGELRDKVEIQSRIETKGQGGGKTKSWQTLDLEWARVWELDAETQMQGKLADMEITHQVAMRYRTDINRNDRILFDDETGTRILRVETVREIGNKKVWIEMACTEDKA